MGLLIWLVIACLMESITPKPVKNWSIREDTVELNNRPIIGIVTEDTTSSYGDEFISAMYVQFLESAGARVVPIRGQRSTDYYKALFNNINGVLFPGGSVSITDGNYYNTGKLMYDYAIEANDEGDYFPIWGTCLGFELLTYLTAGDYLLSDTDSDNLTLPLNFTDDFRESRLFQDMLQETVENLRNKPLTQNNHHYSLLTESYEANNNLNQFYQVLSTNLDRNNLEFVSTMEAHDYPIYATQWHPEKNIFLWDPKDAIAHGYDAIEVTQYMADFFVNEARKSSHHYDTTDEEAKSVIENFLEIYKGADDDSFESTYYFNFTTDTHSLKRNKVLTFIQETGKRPLV